MLPKKNYCLRGWTKTGVGQRTKYLMRELLNLLEQLNEATLEPSQINKYPERFDAFISHIESNRPFYTDNTGEEVRLDPSEAQRFIELKQAGLFKGRIMATDINGKSWPVSIFRKTAEFGGSSAIPNDEASASKEGAQVKPSQIGICDRPIGAGKLGTEIINNTVLAGTDYGRAVIGIANNIVNGEAAIMSREMIKQESLKKAIVDYAGEYLGVLALVNGQSDFPNREEFLEWLGGSLSTLTLKFPSKINTPLADSFAEIINPMTNHQINISSKGTGGGAPPSLSSLVIPDSVKKKKQYKLAVNFIELCQNENLPSPKTVSQIYQAMNLFNQYMPDKIPDEFKPFLPWNASIIPTVRDSLKNGTPMTNYATLFADLDSRGNDGGKLTYVVKKAVMDIVNSGSVPEFQAAVLEILDYNFIQQYTTVTNKTGKLNFHTQWPAKLNGVVTLETKSGGTDPTKGGFSFKLKPVGSKSDAIEKPAIVATPKAHDTSMAADQITRPGRRAEPRTAPAAGPDRQRR
jgi:hypothetical protein